MNLKQLLRLLVIAVPGIAGAAEPIWPVLDEAAYQRNEANYQRLCATCHGADRMGGMGGSLVEGRWRRGGKPEEIFKSVMTGYVVSGMPGFGATLTEEQGREFVSYLLEGARRHASSQREKAEVAPDRELVAAGVALRVETVAAGLEMPWGIAWLPDGQMLVTERTGALRIVGPDGRVSAPIAGTPAVFAFGQGGLMDVAVHPDYARNGWIYLSYSQPRAVRGRTLAFTAIARARIRECRWVEQEMIFEAPEKFLTDSEKHWGCRLVFDRAGHLFFGIGERGEDRNAQDLAHPAGKIHRLHDDGRVPTDNPYAGRADVFPSVWASGVRNPQGLVKDAGGRIFETEHGPRGGDEFNEIVKGKNYGWPVVSRGRNYNFAPAKWTATRADVAEPLLDWSPSIGPSGLAFYEAAAFPAWRGSFLAGGLVMEQLDRVTLNGDGTARRETILKGLGRVRDVRVGPDGFIYVALNHRSRDLAGRIVRLRPPGP